MTKKERFEKLAVQLTDEWQRNGRPIKAQFPIGIIRRIGQLRERWPYLDIERARTVACVIQLCDINRWNLNIWKIELTAGTIWEWHCTLPVIAVIETLCREFALQRGYIKQETKFQKILNTLHSKGVLLEQQWQTLDRLREYRNGVHLYLQGRVEMHDGLPKRYNKAVKALGELEKRLLHFTEMETAGRG
jgi:hypothetical protein